MNRFQAAKELLGHDLAVKQRKVNGSVTMFWAECDCGYKSSEFRNSLRTATGAAIGHAGRVADALRRENSPGVSGAEVPRRGRRRL